LELSSLQFLGLNVYANPDEKRENKISSLALRLELSKKGVRRCVYKALFLQEIEYIAIGVKVTAVLRNRFL
jgi:hypothetical protein